MAALREPRLDAVLLGAGAQLVEAGALGRREVVVRQLRKRRPADERQRALEQQPRR